MDGAILGDGYSMSHKSLLTRRKMHLKDGPKTGNYRFGLASTDKQIKGWVSRADVVDFMLKQISDDTYLHKAPGVSY